MARTAVLSGCALVLLSVAASLIQAEQLGYGVLEESWRGEVEQLSWQPRAFMYKNFLSDEECDHLIGMAAPKMRRSRVVDDESGGTKRDSGRTSTGTWLMPRQDAVVRAIEQRVAAVTMIPEENQESMQILHYVNGQQYEPHHDYFTDIKNARQDNGGQRVATMLMYLSTPEEGGETVFPDSEDKVSGPEWSKCALQGLAVKARKGDALLFYSLTPDGEPDPSSLHGSCPTWKGEKWSATKWIRVGSFVTYVPARRSRRHHQTA